MKARLVEAGIKTTDVVDHHFIKSIYFFDPNGLRLEVTRAGRRGPASWSSRPGEAQRCAESVDPQEAGHAGRKVLTQAFLFLASRAPTFPAKAGLFPCHRRDSRVNIRSFSGGLVDRGDACS